MVGGESGHVLRDMAQSSDVKATQHNREGNTVSRLEICQKIYTTGFFGKQIYTLKVHKLRRFVLKKKQRKCISISYFSRFLLESN